MEVAENDSQRVKRGKGGPNKCRFTFLTHFLITRLFKKRGTSEDFKYDLAKATKTGNVDENIDTIRSRLEIQVPNHSFLLLDTFFEPPTKE